MDMSAPAAATDAFSALSLSPNERELRGRLAVDDARAASCTNEPYTPKYRACADAGIKLWRDASRGERRYFAQRSAEEMASLPAADGPRG